MYTILRVYQKYDDDANRMMKISQITIRRQHMGTELDKGNDQDKTNTIKLHRKNNPTPIHSSILSSSATTTPTLAPIASTSTGAGAGEGAGTGTGSATTAATSWT
jgi:hypothetical protein